MFKPYIQAVATILLANFIMLGWLKVKTHPVCPPPTSGGYGGDWELGIGEYRILFSKSFSCWVLDLGSSTVSGGHSASTHNIS